MPSLRDYLNALPFDEQCDYARRAGTTINYLRKALSTGQKFGGVIARGLDEASHGVVSRHSLRPDIFGAAPAAAAPLKSTRPRALPKDLVEQYHKRSAVTLTGDRLADNHSRKLLLFRVGDYLQAFGDTAEIIADILGLTLCVNWKDYNKTKAGFPSDNADAYIAQIEAAGHGVRIEEPDFGDTNAAAHAKGGAR